MIDLLRIIIDNIQTHDVNVLTNISMTSKHYNNVVSGLWMKQSIPGKDWWMMRYYHHGDKCVKCDKRNHINDFGECYSCMMCIDNHLIDEFDAMTTWNLEKEDFNNLLYVYGKNSIIRKETKYYKESDVILASIYKHNGPVNMYYITNLTDKQRNRYQKVLTICTKYIKIEVQTKFWKRHINPYIQTGKGGIKSLCKKVEQYGRDIGSIIE